MNYSKLKLYVFFTLNIYLFSVSNSFAQDVIKGEVLEQINDTELPILGANVYWLNENVGRVTDENGAFSIPYQPAYKKLIISYVGFKSDTLTIANTNFIKHYLKPSANLDEITISTRNQTSSRSLSSIQNVLSVSSDELLKAACCNLSESFETNPSIDVNFADAITGTRQIQMLGLDSPYILITTENIPAIRGASQAYGLSFIPGTWVESIQITKGAGSVINGFESIAGQINTELQKPSSDYPLFVNFFAGLNGRLELNTHLNHKLNEKWSTGLYIHANQRKEKFDRNDDGFLDVPLKEQINILNRWQYTNPEKGLVSFINLRYLNDNTQAGQIGFNPDTDALTTNSWGSVINTERFEMSSKFGYVNPELPYQSIGVQTAFSFHNQDAYYGQRIYDIEHTSFYSTIMYNSIISDSRHKIKTGLSFMYDDYDELVEQTNYNRVDNAVGGFFEYNYDNLEKLSFTAGIRVDQHNRLGFFLTPRFHLKYMPWAKSAWRLSFGRGKRAANIFAENQNLFSSSREINILNTQGNIYGLDPEIAWNYGVSFQQGFNLFGRKSDITIDFYRTDFENQVVVDWETPTEINFYNLDGNSFYNSFQFEWNYEVLPRVDMRLAYKYYDLQTDYLSGRLQKPLVPKHRIFANLGYTTTPKENGSQWKFDATYNWLGQQRFPSTEANPIAFRLPENTTTIGTLNTQITKVFSNVFEIYIGGENITDVRQNNPILSSENPFGENFDTNFVFGPIFGSNFYAGLRFKVY
jgi:outer membrane receptor for ferrienterochelin and colicin